MTPLSSMLEASNAGHMNPEPITTRWMRGITWRMTREVILMAFFFGWIFNFFFWMPGITWRMTREVIFGIGLNQMSGVTRLLNHV